LSGNNLPQKILWFTWKDLTHPLSGGAEVVNEEIARRLVNSGKKVTFVVGGYKNCKKEKIINGYKVIRLGNRYTLYLHALFYYLKYLKGWPDLVIDEVNTAPFLCKFYVRENNILFFHQLCRGIWFYQFPFPLNLVGYLMEPIYLWLLRDRKVITISESTKRDLMRFGLRDKKISIIPVGIELEPVSDLNKIKKYSDFTVLSLGAIREMKRPDHQIKAFEIAKKEIPELKLKIAGSGSGKYYEKVMKLIENNPYKRDIEYLGRVTKEKKTELMQKSHLILVTSIKEGWGLIVTEANSQGTIAAVYDADGLRDSTKDKFSGLITSKNTPEELAEAILKVYKNPVNYEKMRVAAWVWSKEITFDNCYRKFQEIINEK